MPEHIVSLSVGGSEYFGWLSVSITSDLETIARKFDVSLTRRRGFRVNALFDNGKVDVSEFADDAFAIKLGDDVVVKIDGSPVVTGYISNISVSQTATDMSISISGVSLTGVLNDCTAPDGSSKSFKQQRVGDIVAELAKMYGIKVIDNLKIEDKKDFTLAVDKTIGSAITDLQKNSGFIVTDDESGNLVIINKKELKPAGGALSVGVNVISSSRTSDLSGRFQKYVAIGQGKNPKGGEATTNGPKAYAVDMNVSRDRVKVFKVNGSVNQVDLQKRVDLTCMYLSAAGESIEYVVPGWYDNAGDLWRSGTVVGVRDFLALDADETKLMAVKSVAYTLDGNGTRTNITVKPLDAYTGTDYSSGSQAVEKAAKDKAKQAKTAKKKSSKKTAGGASWDLKSGSGKLS